MDYVPEEPQLLSFKTGDVIRVEDKNKLVEGMLYGVVDGKAGYFPAKCVTDLEVSLDMC